MLLIKGTGSLPIFLPCATTFTEFLFPQKYGDHVSMNTIQQDLRRVNKRIGFKCYPHLFRHTFVTSYLNKGGPRHILKEILGHESDQSMEKYLHPMSEDFKK